MWDSARGTVAKLRCRGCAQRTSGAPFAGTDRHTAENKGAS